MEKGSLKSLIVHMGIGWHQGLARLTLAEAHLIRLIPVPSVMVAACLYVLIAHTHKEKSNKVFWATGGQHINVQIEFPAWYYSGP